MRILFEGNFGKSLWQSTPVAAQLMARLPITFELGAMALIVGLMVAIPIDVYSAVRQDSGGDYVARSFSILMLAVPSFWIGTMVMVFPSIWGAGRRPSSSRARRARRPAAASTPAAPRRWTSARPSTRRCATKAAAARWRVTCTIDQPTLTPTSLTTNSVVACAAAVAA